MSTVTIYELAREAVGWFELVERDGMADGADSSCVRLKDGAPIWVPDLVDEGHARPPSDSFPDDYRYAVIRNALGWIGWYWWYDPTPGDGAHEFAEKHRPRDDADLVAWLASSPARGALVDEAAVTYGGPAEGIEALAAGQWLELRETYDTVWGYLEDLAISTMAAQEDT